MKEGVTFQICERHRQPPLSDDVLTANLYDLQLVTLLVMNKDIEILLAFRGSLGLAKNTHVKIKKANLLGSTVTNCYIDVWKDLGKITRVTCIFCLSKIFISIFRRQRLTTATFNTKTFERKISGKKETFSFLLRVLSFVVKRVFRF